MRTMNVGVVDIDSHHFPNLVLMKLSAWHKVHDDTVELLTPDDVLSGINLFVSYEKLYGACVFTENNAVANRLERIGVHVAGSGTGKQETLPDEIEHIMPDYSLYGITDTAYGFLSRGCPRGCPFCIVAGKEGMKSRKVADLSEWWDGQKEIKLLDPNLLACNESMELLGQLADSGAWIDITQGLDARLLNRDNIAVINRMRVKMLHFAWDNPRDDSIKSALQMFAMHNNLNSRKLGVYVLTNYWSTLQEDLMRVYWLRDNGYNPYIMVYDKPHAPKEICRLQRWVNNKFIFRSCDKFEDYVA